MGDEGNICLLGGVVVFEAGGGDFDFNGGPFFLAGEASTGGSGGEEDKGRGSSIFGDGDCSTTWEGESKFDTLDGDCSTTWEGESKFDTDGEDVGEDKAGCRDDEGEGVGGVAGEGVGEGVGVGSIGGGPAEGGLIGAVAGTVGTLEKVVDSRGLGKTNGGYMGGLVLGVKGLAGCKGGGDELVLLGVVKGGCKGGGDKLLVLLAGVKGGCKGGGDKLLVLLLGVKGGCKGGGD
ncbi:hypothetical protein CEUSTIGMA_g11697.t1, partial [Chlamydomonas eustigma]